MKSIKNYLNEIGLNIEDFKSRILKGEVYCNGEKLENLIKSLENSKKNLIEVEIELKKEIKRRGL